MDTTTPAGDELVASSVPGADKALHTGHLLYAAEILVATLREKLASRAYPPSVRQRYEERLVEVVETRDHLDDAYREALAAVRAASPMTADLVDDAVWRVQLIEED